MVVGARLSHSGQWGLGCWWRGIPSVCGGGIGGDTPIVIVFGFGVGLLGVGEGAAFVGIDSGGGRHIFSLEGIVSPGIPRGIAGRCRASFRSCGKFTSVKILPRLLRLSRQATQAGSAARAVLLTLPVYSHFRRTHTSGVLAHLG